MHKQLIILNLLNTTFKCLLVTIIIYWILGLQVKGIETDPNWWKSPYITLYIPHIYEEDQLCLQVLEDTESVIMFCYFNNGPAFMNYMEQFKGNCLIIIGPKCKRHTNPHPFHPKFQTAEWVLKECKQIKSTEDYIVVYDRVKS